MFTRVGLINYPVNNLEEARDWYSAQFGIEPYLDSPQYVGYKVGELLIGLNPNGKNEGMTGPVIFWLVEDAQKAYDELLSSGATASREPQQLGNQILASVHGLDGNLTGIIQILHT